jgi:hypothetical protein
MDNLWLCPAGHGRRPLQQWHGSDAGIDNPEVIGFCHTSTGFDIQVWQLDIFAGAGIDNDKIQMRNSLIHQKACHASVISYLTGQRNQLTCNFPRRFFQPGLIPAANIDSVPFRGQFCGYGMPYPGTGTGDPADFWELFHLSSPALPFWP